MKFTRKCDNEAPCKFKFKNDDGKATDHYPAVSCEFDCSKCGWNPEEQKRRLNEGKWKWKIKYLDIGEDK